MPQLLTSTKHIFLCAIILTTLLLGGCGTTPNNFVSPPATNNISSTDIYVTIGQKEITAEVEQSNAAAAGGGGLLLALIDVAVEGARSNTAEELIQPIKDTLIDTDFNTVFIEALQTELSGVDWLNVNDIVLHSDFAENQLATDFDNSKADAALFVSANYALSSNFANLKAYSSMQLLPKSEALKAYSEKPNSKKAKANQWHIDNNLYRDSVAVEKILVTGTKKKQNASELKENPELVKENLITLAKLLASEIKNSIATQATEKN